MAKTVDNQFEVKLGRIRSPSGSRKVTSFFRKVARGANSYGAPGRRAGGGVRQRHEFFRRVVVKVHLVRMDAKGASAQRLHLNYVERDGTGRDGEPAKLYDETALEADKDAFLERGAEDRHQFRIIVSPEDANELQDLTAFTRDLVSEMERDLGTKLDWVAANHYDTGQPHTHLIISGKRDDGEDLVIPRDYIARGIRKRAQELVELELGPVPEIDGRNRMAQMVNQERFTTVDREIFGDAENGIVDLSAPTSEANQWRKQLARMRMAHLEKMGLATRLKKGRWRIADDAETTLKEMGARGDIIKSMHRAMADRDQTGMMDASSIFDPGAHDAKAVTGVIVEKGIADDVNDRAFIVVESLEGKPVYAIIGGEGRLPELNKGEIVTISPPRTEPRASDYTIAKIASANNSRYTSLAHMEADKTARPEFVQAHMRRLEALRRRNHVVRDEDGSWHVPPDYLERARRYEQEMVASRPADITRHSHLQLSQMKTAIGKTWLDEQLRDFDDEPDARGFGGDVEIARAARRKFLMQQGFIEKDQLRLNQSALDALQSRDLNAAGAELTTVLGKSYAPAPETGRIEGVYSRAIDRPSGRFAVIERARDFSMVPWRDVLERNHGKSVSGIIRPNGISWRLTRGRTVS